MIPPLTCRLHVSEGKANEVVNEQQETEDQVTEEEDVQKEAEAAVNKGHNSDLSLLSSVPIDTQDALSTSLLLPGNLSSVSSDSDDSESSILDDDEADGRYDESAMQIERMGNEVIACDDEAVLDQEIAAELELEEESYMTFTNVYKKQQQAKPVQPLPASGIPSTNQLVASQPGNTAPVTASTTAPVMLSITVSATQHPASTPGGLLHSILNEKDTQRSNMDKFYQPQTAPPNVIAPVKVDSILNIGASSQTSLDFYYTEDEMASRSLPPTLSLPPVKRLAPASTAPPITTTIQPVELSEEDLAFLQFAEMYDPTDSNLTFRTNGASLNEGTVRDDSNFSTTDALSTMNLVHTTTVTMSLTSTATIKTPVAKRLEGKENNGHTVANGASEEIRLNDAGDGIMQSNKRNLKRKAAESSTQAGPKQVKISTGEGQAETTDRGDQSVPSDAIDNYDAISKRIEMDTLPYDDITEHEADYAAEGDGDEAMDQFGEFSQPNPPSTSTTDAKHSPFLTPFTASKFKQTPGRYLYLPQIDTDLCSLTSSKLTSSVIKPYEPTSHHKYDPHCESPSSIKSPLWSRVPVDKTFYAEDVCMEPGGTAFGYRDLRKVNNCRVFFQNLLHCRCFSFELVFQKLPSLLLSSPAHRRRWFSLISQFCPLDSSSKTHGVCSNDNLAFDNTNQRTNIQDPHILAGIAFNFGDNYGYYLPLPFVPPLPRCKGDGGDAVNKGSGPPFDRASQPDMDRSFSTSISHTSSSQHTALTLSSLPPKCHKIICRFVGFPLIFNKCPYLCSRLRGEPLQHAAFQTFSQSQSGATSHSQSNPLMLVSRYWCGIARDSLAIEWRKGQCVEYRLLNEIMTNPKITKVAMNMKLKLAALRERDVIVAGALEDPSIAYPLLTPSYVQGKALEYKEIPSKLKYPLNFDTTPTGTPSLRCSERAIRLSCYRATAVLRSMATLSHYLHKQKQMWELFHQIEMQLLYSVSDIEFHRYLKPSHIYTHVYLFLLCTTYSSSYIPHTICTVLYQDRVGLSVLPDPPTGAAGAPQGAGVLLRALLRLPLQSLVPTGCRPDQGTYVLLYIFCI